MFVEVILLFLLHCFICFAIIYSYDRAELWYNHKDKLSLYQPTLYDLEDGNNLDNMQRYTKEIISPSYHYFKIYEEIEDAQKEDEIPFITFFLLLSIGLLISQTLNEVFSLEWVAGLVALIVCLIGYFISYIIYHKFTNLALSKFEYSSLELKELFERQEGYSKYNISKKSAFNNFVITKHNAYLNSIQATIFFRYWVRKSLIFVSGIIYLVFFMRIPT